MKLPKSWSMIIPLLLAGVHRVRRAGRPQGELDGPGRAGARLRELRRAAVGGLFWPGAAQREGEAKMALGCLPKADQLGLRI